MFSSLALLFLALALPASAATCPSVTCHDVHFFLARGNNEPYPGRQGDLVAATCSGLSSCGYEDLIYSALYTDLSCQSTYDGAVAGLTQIPAYVEACPDSKIILAGYSQGAQIMTDILGGGGGVSFNGCVQPETPALSRSTSPGSKIAAVIVFGNTRHTADQSYDYGSGSADNGYFPRTSTMLAALDDYADIMRDWCDESDPICALGDTVATHLAYFSSYSDQAASWIKSVASITDNDPSFTTSIATMVSGTAQDYATIGTATPSGTVTVDTTWTLETAVVSCTGGGSRSSESASASKISTSSTASKTGSSSSSVTTSKATTSTDATVASKTSSVSATSTSKSGAVPSGSIRMGMKVFAAIVSTVFVYI